VKREATIAGLASEGLALISGSAGAGISAVMGPPADPVEMNCRQESQILAPKKNIHEIGQGFCLQFWHLWARRNPFPGLKLKKNQNLRSDNYLRFFKNNRGKTPRDTNTPSNEGKKQS